MAKKSQVDKIETFLQRGRALTVNEAFSRFGVQRLAARIFDLRSEGLSIATHRNVVNGRKITRYTLNRS